MTVHVATLEFGHVSAGGESPGGAALGAEASLSFSSLAFSADPEGGAGLVLRLPLRGVELTSAELQFAVATGMVSAQAIGGSSIQWINQKPAASANLANAAGEAALVDRPRLSASKALWPEPMIRISGAALADYGALATADGRVTFRRLFGSLVSSYVLGMKFLDTATDSLTDPSTFLRRVEASAIYGTPSVIINGNTVLAGGATYIANDPLGVVWIAPGDLGPANNQIPTALANNNAAAYEQFPSVWLTDSAAVGFVRLVELRTDPITVDFGQVTVMQVNRPPTHSRWQLDINGTCLEVIVAHPVGSNLRTAKAAWSAVWAPLTSGVAVNQGPVIFEQVIGGTFRPLGVLNNTNFIRAFRFIEPLDANAAIASVVVQT